MKAVLRQVDPAELERRRKLGLDRWDEMWEGVLHMSPAPANEHQRIVGELYAFLMPLLKRTKRGTLWMAVNVFDRSSPTQNYRIPDLSFVATGRESIVGEVGMEGGPDAVIEVRSPDDETYEKLPFFAGLGVREVIVIDRDSKRPEIFRLAGEKYVAVSTDANGWIVAETMHVRFRREPAGLRVEDRDDPATFVMI